jgi:hypothetical protein
MGALSYRKYRRNLMPSPLVVFLALTIPFVAMVAAVETGRLDPLVVLGLIWVAGIAAIGFAAFSTWKLWRTEGSRAEGRLPLAQRRSLADRRGLADLLISIRRLEASQLVARWPSPSGHRIATRLFRQ